MTEALAVINLAHLKQAPNTPFLYESGVVYRPERDGEELLDIPALMVQGWGDCEDLAAWRVAELRFNDIPAWVEILIQQNPTRGNDEPKFDYHLLVGTPWGKQDPSKELGM
jgi:hypothetical protein